jgi:hypothetical protein
MAISFNCPHCLEPYRLKDELGGKQAKCKNPECRQLITIPKAITISDDAKLSAEEAEAAALAALNEEAPAAQVQETAPAEKMIPMVCKFCDHQWSEPVSKAGKNVLCPNPDCRQRAKVPEPKDDKEGDWRQTKSKLPEGAKQNQPKLEGVVSAGEVTYVRPESLQQADATGIEYEPRPLKQVIMMWLTGIGLVLAVGGGIWYYSSRRTEVKDDRLMIEAREEFAATRKEWVGFPDKSDAKVEWAAKQAGLYSAVLSLAASEYALRHETADQTKEAHTRFNEARNDLRATQGLDRDAIVAELVFAVLGFAGTDEQAKEQVRYAWTPDTQSGRVPRMNEQSRTIHSELQTTLQLLEAANLEFKLSVARRLARELTKRGHADMAADLVPQRLFSDAQRNEGRAAIALEIHRTDGGSPLPRSIADDLKRQLTVTNPPGIPTPSAHALFVALKVEKAPSFPPPPPAGDVPEATRIAHTAAFLLDGKQAEALALAQRPPNARLEPLKALVLCAEWAADPNPALDAAQALLSKGTKTQSPTAAFHLLRLSQIAAEKGRPDVAKAFADAIADPGLKAWALGESVRLRTRANASEKANAEWIDVPESPRDLRAGHAWGRLWVARHNAKLSGDRDAEKAAVYSWPQPIHPFALAGIALGLQDK